MQSWQILLIVVGVVVVGGVAILSRRANRLRAGNIEAQLSRHGWSRRNDDPALTTRWHGAPFGQGRDPQASNVISGGYRGHRVLAFDYSILTRFQEGEARETYAIYAVTLPARVPDLELVPEGVADRMRTALGGGDLRLGDGDFDRMFRIGCSDSGYAAAVLTPEVRRQLLDAGKQSYRFENDTLLMWEFGSVDTYALDPNRLERHFDGLVTVLELVPDDVWRRYGKRPS